MTTSGTPGWLSALNDAPAEAAAQQLLPVCSSRRWAEQVAGARPFARREDLLEIADQVWLGLGPGDWLAALAGHPRIGERGGAAQEHSRQEQAGMQGAAPSVLQGLREGNSAYEARFGHVFLIAAAGRGAEEILGELRRRLRNSPEEELREAAEQHRRIARLRLERLLAADSADG